MPGLGSVSVCPLRAQPREWVLLVAALLGQEMGLAGWGVMSGEQRVKASSFFLCQGEKKQRSRELQRGVASPARREGRVGQREPRGFSPTWNGEGLT